MNVMKENGKEGECIKMKIDDIIIDKVNHEITMFNIIYKRKPNYVILAPWMISILKESMKNLLDYTNGVDEEAHTLYGLIIIESIKVEDLNDIEVY